MARLAGLKLIWRRLPSTRRPRRDARCASKVPEPEPASDCFEYVGSFRARDPEAGIISILAMRVYKDVDNTKDVDYDGMIMPDHAPHIAGDARNRQAYAFEFGYIAALIQLMHQEG